MTGPHVLIVEDDPGSAEIVAAVVERLGGSPACLPDPMTALGTLRSRSFDVIVADYGLPRMNGIQLLRHARHLQPHCARLMLTGRRDYELALDAINYAGVFRFLSKPIDEVALASAIHTAAAEHAQVVRLDELRRQLRERDRQLRREHRLRPTG